jgi:hypothetical protein
MVRFVGLPILFALSCAALPVPSAAATGTPRPLAIGDRLPELSGDFLTGKRAVLPQASQGKVALLALGFTYNSRFPVDAWTSRFREAFGRAEGVTSFEIPMLGGAARLGRWFIDSGMRKGTPKELHENVITVYGSTGDWKARLRFAQEDVAYLILLDGAGHVRWLHHGVFDEQAFRVLRETVTAVLQEPATRVAVRD